MNIDKIKIVKWWIILEQKHFGVLVEGQEVYSKYDIEYFNDENTWLERLKELKINI